MEKLFAARAAQRNQECPRSFQGKQSSRDSRLLKTCKSFPLSRWERAGVRGVDLRRDSGFERALTLTLSQRERGPDLGAAIELGHHEFAVTERFSGGESAVGGADDHVDQCVTRLVERLFAAKDARDIQV